jgi:manganese transport protein
LLENLLDSRLAPAVFGLGLLCAGQSSTLTGTLAGQIVMEGFVQMRIKPWIRRLVTRLIAIVPAVIVILIAGQEGTYKLLIFSQVVLSLQLPFAVVPLIKFTSSNRIMGPGGMFKNTLWINVMSWISAGVIVVFNVFMLVSNFLIPLFKGSWLSITFAVVIVSPLSLALSAFLVYLALRKDDDTTMQYGNLELGSHSDNNSLAESSNSIEMSSVSSSLPSSPSI